MSSRLTLEGLNNYADLELRRNTLLEVCRHMNGYFREYSFIIVENKSPSVSPDKIAQFNAANDMHGTIMKLIVETEQKMLNVLRSRKDDSEFEEVKP